MWIVASNSPYYPAVYRFDTEAEAIEFYGLQKESARNSSGRYSCTLFIAEVKETFDFMSSY